MEVGRLQGRGRDAARCWSCSPTSRPRPIRSSSTAAPSLITAAGPTNTKRRCAAGPRARSSSTPPRRPATAGTWCATPGAARTPFVKLASGREGAGVRGLDHARGGRETAGAGGQDRGRTAGGRGQARFQADRPGDSGARPHSLEDPRDRNAQRGRHDSGQRPEIERRGRDLQRALGPPGGRHAGGRATRFTTAPSTTPRAARFCWSWRARGARSQPEAASAPRCSLR